MDDKPKWDTGIGDTNWRRLMPSNVAPLPTSMTGHAFWSAQPLSSNGRMTTHRDSAVAGIASDTENVKSSAQSVVSRAGTMTSNAAIAGLFQSQITTIQSTQETGNPFKPVRDNVTPDAFSADLDALRLLIQKGEEETSRATEDAIQQLRVAAMGIQVMRVKDELFDKPSKIRTVGGGGRMLSTDRLQVDVAASDIADTTPRPVVESPLSTAFYRGFDTSAAVVEKEAAEIRSRTRAASAKRARSADRKTARTPAATDHNGHVSNHLSGGADAEFLQLDAGMRDFISASVAHLREGDRRRSQATTPKSYVEATNGLTPRSRHNLRKPASAGRVRPTGTRSASSAAVTPSELGVEGHAQRDSHGPSVDKFYADLDQRAKAIIVSSKASVPESIRKMQDDLLAKYADTDETEHRHAMDAEVAELLSPSVPMLQAMPLRPFADDPALEAATQASQAAAARAAQKALHPGRIPGSSAKEQLANLKERLRRLSKMDATTPELELDSRRVANVSDAIASMPSIQNVTPSRTPAKHKHQPQRVHGSNSKMVDNASNTAPESPRLVVRAHSSKFAVRH